MKFYLKIVNKTNAENMLNDLLPCFLNIEL